MKLRWRSPAAKWEVALGDDVRIYMWVPYSDLCNNMKINYFVPGESDKTNSIHFLWPSYSRPSVMIKPK